MPGPSTSAAAWTLAVLTVLNFLNYIDRLVLPAVLGQMKQDPVFRGVSDAELGLLSTAFVVVYMLMSPLAGVLGVRVPRRYVVAAGVGLWSLATVWSGLARSYPEMLIARAVIGFGEAGYATVAPAMIGDLYAPSRRARVLAIFYLATPVGSALGYLVGGWVAQAASWRAAFLVAGAPGLACALAALTMTEPERGAMDRVEGERAGARVPLGEALGTLVRSSLFRTITGGTTLWVFAVGGLAFWLSVYFQEAHGLDAGTASTAVGGVTVVAGVLGTVIGSWWADVWARRERARLADGAEDRAYLRFSGVGLVIAAPLLLLAPLAGSLWACLGLVFLAEFCVFVNTGPGNAVLVSASPPAIRELGVGLHVLMIHMLGDAVSPPVVGALRGWLARLPIERSLAQDLPIMVLALPLAAGGVVFLVGAKWLGQRRSGQTRRP